MDRVVSTAAAVDFMAAEASTAAAVGTVAVGTVAEDTAKVRMLR